MIKISHFNFWIVLIVWTVVYTCALWRRTIPDVSIFCHWFWIAQLRKCFTIDFQCDGCSKLHCHGFTLRKGLFEFLWFSWIGSGAAARIVVATWYWCTKSMFHNQWQYGKKFVSLSMKDVQESTYRSESLEFVSTCQHFQHVSFRQFMMT